MWTEQIVLGLIGLSSGVAVAGGLFAFIVELGVVADLADRTHTAESLLLYEDSIALGGILGNAVFCFQIMIPCAGFILPFFGVLSGIFVGCWAMALAEILNVFPFYQESQAGTLYQVVYHRDCTWKRLWSMYWIFAMIEVNKINKKLTIN